MCLGIQMMKRTISEFPTPPRLRIPARGCLLRLPRAAQALLFSVWLAVAVPVIVPSSSSAAAPPHFEAYDLFGTIDVGANAAPAFADIDGDGDLDLFVGNLDGNVVFFENTGTAQHVALASPVTNPFGLAGVRQFSVPTFADIDGDGDLDLFVGAWYGSTFFFANTGTAQSPAFASPVENPFGLAAVDSFAAPAFADIDGDGDLDAFVGGYSGSLLFFANTGTAQVAAFASPVTAAFGLFGVPSHESVPAFADIDGDGDLDAFVGQSAEGAFFFRNTGTVQAPAFDLPVIAFAGDTATQTIPRLVDIDGDGDLDGFEGRQDGSIVFFPNLGTPQSPAFVQRADNPFGIPDILPDNDYGAAPSFADIDGDGDLDLFAGQQTGDTVFFANTGTAESAAFAKVSLNPFGLSDVGAWSVPAFADIDGDGDLDAFVGEQGGSTFFFQNTGTPQSPAFAGKVPNPFGLAPVGGYAVPAFADIDGDGDLDLFVGAQDGSTYFFENSGTGQSPAFASPTTNPFGLADVGSYAVPTLVDIDGDGDLDAFVGEVHGSTFFFENTGTVQSPAFVAPVTNPLGLVAFPMAANTAFADLDGDGDLDALVAEGAITARFFFFENTAVTRIFADGFESGDLQHWAKHAP